MNLVLQILFGIGILQAIILGTVLLLKSGSNKLISKLLASVLFITSLIMISEILDLFEFKDYNPSLFNVSILIDVLLPPLIWLLTLSILGKKNSFSNLDLLHFIPFGLGLIWVNTGYKWHGAESPGTFSHIPNAIALLVLFKWIIWILYISLSLKESYSKNVLNDIKLKKVNKELLRKLIWPNTIIVILSYFTFWLMYFGIDTPIDSDYLSVLLIVVFVYYLTFSILLNPNLFLETNKKSSFPKYYKSNLTTNTITEYIVKLNDYMENQKPFLDKKLSLNELSNVLNISPNALSQVINEGLGKTFNDFVNGYRIKHIKIKLTDSSQDYKTMLALAFESGFQSKASFNRIFKKHEGMTPSKYRNIIRS